MTAQSADVAAPPRYVFTTFIRSTPERIWQALTDSDFTVNYYYHSTVHTDWAVGTATSTDTMARRRSRASSSRRTRRVASPSPSRPCGRTPSGLTHRPGSSSRSTTRNAASRSSR